jgi:phosphate transport system ATP-binding protein
MAIDPRTAENLFRPEVPTADKIAFANASLFYGQRMALHNVTLGIPARQVTALIGPTGCGRSSLLRSLNRSNDPVRGFRVEGTIELDGQNLYAPGFDLAGLRRRVAMVYERPSPMPRSIFENVAVSFRDLNPAAARTELNERVQQALTDAGLWREVADRLNDEAQDLSHGQQRRLCIANALARQPEVLLLDDPTYDLDPIATQRIEELIVNLKKRITVVLVTNNMQQAARVSDRTAFLWLGKLIEVNTTRRFFTCPAERLTEDFITGRLA